MKVSIIVPFYNAWHHTHRCLMDLYRSGQGKYEIVLVDDASTDVDVQTGLKWWKETEFIPFRYFRRKENGGFGESMNYGVSKSTGDIVILLSNDVQISGNYDLGADVMSYLYNNPKSIVGGELVDWQAGWNQFDNLTIPYLYGWLLAFVRDDWDRLGGFDKIYAPYDYEDVDICTTALLNGYRLVPLNTPFLRHVSGGTINVDVEASKRRYAHTELNREKFKNKWQEKFGEISLVLEKMSV